jgi:O-antigen/teichoic acid export membrane protein
MIALGVLPFAILSILGPEIFGLFLGDRWTESGVYAQILTPLLFVVFVLGSILNLFGTLGKQELNLITSTLYLILRVGIIIYGGLLLQDIRLTLFIFMVSNVLVNLWQISMLLRATKLSAMRPLKYFMRCTAYVVPSTLLIAAMKWSFSLQAVYLVALTPVFSIPYVIFVLRNDHELRNLFLKYLRKVQPYFK